MPRMRARVRGVPEAPLRRLTDRLARLRPRTRALAGLAAGAVAAMGQAPLSVEALGVAGLFAGAGAVPRLRHLAERPSRPAGPSARATSRLALFWIVEPFLSTSRATAGWRPSRSSSWRRASRCSGARPSPPPRALGEPARAWASSRSRCRIAARLCPHRLSLGARSAMSGSAAARSSGGVGRRRHGLTLLTLLRGGAAGSRSPAPRRPGCVVAPLPFVALALSAPPGACRRAAPAALSCAWSSPTPRSPQKWDPDRVAEFYRPPARLHRRARRPRPRT